MIAPILETLLRGDSLDAESTTFVMHRMMAGEASDAEIAAFLIAMRAKGASGTELAACARVMREKAISVALEGDWIDTCGTGGGMPTFNLSTAAALIASAAGVKVAKHGNRAMTSKCGSADVLEALGAHLPSDPLHLLRVAEETGLVFLFAQAHHPAMKHVGPVRRQLGVRTIFNQLGPLSNPVQATRQIVGVYDADLQGPMADALVQLGVERAWLVTGADGLDEISPCAPTTLTEVELGVIRQRIVSPADFGLSPLDPSALVPGETVTENAAIVREALSDCGSVRFEAVLPSAAAAIYLASAASSLTEAVDRAREVVSSGAAQAHLIRFVEATQSDE